MKRTLTNCRLTLEELEPRQLLSADFAPVPLEPAPLPTSPLHQAVVSTLPTQDAAAQYSGALELVFVDPRVPERERLLADLLAQSASGRRFEIITLDASRDGIVQVTEALAVRMQVDAVHFIAHGTDAAVQLGGSWLNAKTLAANAEAVASWGHALKEDGDLLFYGCDLASSARGRALMDWVAELTQADVAASTDKTGVADQGGNWTLEYKHGQIDTRIAVSAKERAQWQGLLASAVLASPSDPGAQGTSVTAAPLGTAGAGTQLSTASGQSGTREIVFVDAATPDYQKLIEDIRAQSSGARELEVVLLQADSDGIAQISRTLAGRSDIDAVHLISHGADGAVQLGGSTLNFDSLLANADQIKGWGSALREQADILVYGCDVAASDAGRSLIEALARLTGADVAASDDVTGSAALGGDWELEYQTGYIDTQDVISLSMRLDWRATLQTVAVGSETLINTTIPGAQQFDANRGHAIAMDANGNSVVVWSGSGSGDTSGIFAQRFDSNGAPQGTEFRVNFTTANAQSFPAVAMDASGNFVVTWTSALQDTSGDGVYARRFDAAGNPLSGDILVNTYITNQQQVSAIAMNPAGDFVIVWQSFGQDAAASWGVYGQRYNAAGVAQGAEFRVNVGTAGDQYLDAVAMDAAGNFIVTFASNASGTWDVYARRYDAAGNPLSGEVVVNSTIPGVQGSSSVAMDSSGNYVVAWRSDGQDGSMGGIYAQRFNAAGVAQGLEFRVNTTTADNQNQPFVAMDASGNFVVIWSSNNQDAAGTLGIYKQEYNADGSADGVETRVNTTTAGNQQFASAAMSAQGDFIVAWSGNGTGDADGVFLQRYSDGVVVTTTNDVVDGNTSSIAALILNKGADGLISLREAITAANATANVGDPDRIRFNIAGAGPHTIALLSALPNITGPTDIDGWSEPDYVPGGNPVIVIDGNNVLGNGLTLTSTADGNRIRGLVIRDFNGNGIEIQAGSDNNQILGNYIGRLQADGNAAAAGEENTGDGIHVRGQNNTIGGTTAAARNVVSGNTDDGIEIFGAGATGNVVQGNYIGLNAAGNAAIGNGNDGFAIWLARNNTIGGTTPGAGNVISANQSGIYIGDITATGNTIVGNYIGTNAAGTAAIGNITGIYLDAANTTVGGTTAAERNVISGNTWAGLWIAGANNVVVQGNYIGTAATGASAIANNRGVYFTGAASNNTIGGTAAGAGNVISGNTNEGILIDGGTSNTVIRGNYIGVAANGTSALGNGQEGIQIMGGSPGTIIGGSAAGAGNVIGANGASSGAAISIEADGTDNTVVQGNWIGTDQTATQNLGNIRSGVEVRGTGVAATSPLNTLIGGTNPGEGNIIRFNALDGVRVRDNAQEVRILGNSISQNGQIGIDLWPAGADDNVTPNDAPAALDADTGANGLQNFPVLYNAATTGTQVMITGALNSAASRTYRIEFFNNPLGTGASISASRL